MSGAPKPRFNADQVRGYYDRHTPGFVAFGQGGGSGAIHRAVRGPGVRNEREAVHYVDAQIAALIAERLSTSPTPHIVDLGCGVGGSLCHLASRLPVRGTGITLSPVQATIARQRIDAAGLADRVTCLEGDYNDLPRDLDPANLAFAIESFVHGPSPARFFQQCRHLIKPGGLLVICDDFRRPTADPSAQKSIDRFCRGWHINSLLTSEELRTLAQSAGFTHDSTVDLSPHLQLRRLRDRVIAALLPVLERLPLAEERIDHLIGGNALQTCLEKGWVGYEFVVFR